MYCPSCLYSYQISDGFVLDIVCSLSLSLLPPSPSLSLSLHPLSLGAALQEVAERALTVSNQEKTSKKYTYLKVSHHGGRGESVRVGGGGRDCAVMLMMLAGASSNAVALFPVLPSPTGTWSPPRPPPTACTWRCASAVRSTHVRTRAVA